MSTASSRASWPWRRGASGGGAGVPSAGASASDACDAPSRRRPSTIHNSSPKTTTASRIQPRKARTSCHAGGRLPGVRPSRVARRRLAQGCSPAAPVAAKSAARGKATTIRRTPRLTLRSSVIDGSPRRHRPDQA